jgi:DNA polymerase III subunit beta
MSDNRNHITFDRDAALKAMNAVARVVEKRNSIPILSNILLECAAGSVQLTSTNLDIEATIKFDAEMQPLTMPNITIPASLLHDILKKLANKAQVSLEWLADGKVVLRSGRSRFQLQSLPANDFPHFEESEFDTHFKIARTDLIRVIEKTQFAISTEETRYYLNGIYLHTNDTDLIAVATDGHRLSKITCPLPASIEKSFGVIIPRKTVSEILQLSKETDDEINIALSNNKIRITAGATQITSRLIDGTFPDYMRIIPHSNDKHALIQREALLTSVDRVAAITSERGRAVKLEFSNSKLTLSVTNPEAGFANEETEIDYNKDAITIGFNAKYLTDVLSHMTGETVLIQLGESGSPTLFVPRIGADHMVVLMPMRV